MRPLSPMSESIARSSLQSGATMEATTAAVNCLRGRDQYAIDDIRNFQRTDPLFLSQQILHLESQRHGIENATGGIDDQIKALKNALYQALTQKISTLQRQNSSLMNFDGSISRQIQALEQQLNALVAQHSQPAPMAPAPSSSQAIQSTRDSQHDNPPLHAPSTSRLGPQSFPSSLRSSQGLGSDGGQSSNLGAERHEFSNGMPTEYSGGKQARRKKNASNDDIKSHMYNADGSLRTRIQIERALRNSDFSLNDTGFTAQIQAVRADLRRLGVSDQRRTDIVRPPASDDQIRAHLRDGDGRIRTYKEILSDLHEMGLGASDNRVASLKKEIPR